MGPVCLAMAIKLMTASATTAFIISVTTTRWARTITLDSRSQIVDIGLFKLSLDSEPHTYLEVPGSLVAVRALIILALIGSMAVYCLGALIVLCQRFRQPSSKFLALTFLILIITESLASIGYFVFKYVATEDITRTYGFSPNATFGFSCTLALMATSFLGALSGLVLVYIMRMHVQE